MNNLRLREFSSPSRQRTALLVTNRHGEARTELEIATSRPPDTTEAEATNSTRSTTNGRALKASKIDQEK